MSNKDRDLSKQMIEAGLLLRLVQNRNMYPACPGLSAEKILTLLKSRPGISEKELADLSGIRRSRLASWLERLEYEGLVELDSRDGDDAKVILTKAGAKEAGKIERSRAKAESLFDCLPDEDREKLSDILDRLLSKLKEETGEDGEELDDLAELRRRHHFGGRIPCPDLHAFPGKPGRFPW